MLSKEIQERAKLYGYHNLFAHKDSIDDVLRWTKEAVPVKHHAAAITAVMMAVNSLAVIIAKSELEGESDVKE